MNSKICAVAHTLTLCAALAGCSGLHLEDGGASLPSDPVLAPSAQAWEMLSLDPLQISQDPLERRFILAGGPLAAPAELPLWITLDETGEDEGRCWLDTELVAAPIDARRVYLDQRSARCGEGEGLSCRVYDAADGSLTTPESCMEPTSGVSYGLQSLGDGWWVSRCYQEGPCVASLVRWAPRMAEQKVWLPWISEVEHTVERRADHFRVRSRCHPLEGGCDYEVLMYDAAPLMEYAWAPDQDAVTLRQLAPAREAPL